MADKEREVVTEAEARQERQRQAAREAAEHRPDKPLTETEPGGRYLLDDGKTVVNAQGEPVKDK